MKIKLIGFSCSSKFCVVQEVEPNEKVEHAIKKLEKIVPCTQIIEIMHGGRSLNRNKSFKHYGIAHENVLEVETNTEEKLLRKGACMKCCYHNLIYLSANITREYETQAQINHEAVKASICQTISKLNLTDQIELKKFINSVTDGLKTRFMVCAKDMFETYVKKYRNIEYGNLIDFDYCQLLNKLRCPVCFIQFQLKSQSSNIPIELCTMSDKHYTCHQCFKKVQLCPLCNGKLRGEATKSKYVMDLLHTSQKKIEAFCLPTSLHHITVEDIQRPFAHGAFCNVFKVGSYAVKCPRVPTLSDSDIENAILHEIFVSRPLSHIPNILIIYGGIRLSNYGISIAMEFIDGPCLGKALFDGTILNLTFEQRLDIALGICTGLGELHLAGIIHRDFKPANILLQKDPERPGYIPKIADFGVSFLIQTASATSVRKSCGTVGYDAPEVADGNTPSVESDIYALSFTLYELCTVQHPFEGLKDAQIITKFTLKGERPTDWNILSAYPTVKLVPHTILRDTIERGWLANPEDRSTIGQLICAIRKTIDSNYVPCVTMLSNCCLSAINQSNDFIEHYDTLELLAIQEIIKRVTIEDSEAVHLLLNNDAWG